MTKIKLPKKYEMWENTPEKYHQYIGYPKISYSQYSSWKDLKYRPDYIKQYFFGLDTTNQFQVFAEFGSACGEWLEGKGMYSNTGVLAEPGDFEHMLTDSDIDVLDSIDLSGENTYEEEIVFPVKDSKGNILFVVQGFIDKSKKLEKSITICDFKTGATKKEEFYGSDEYGQTTLYAHCLAKEGHKIERSYVQLLCRKGNNRKGHPIRLEGGIIEVETPYSNERGERVVESIKSVATEISKYYTVLTKIRKK